MTSNPDNRLITKVLEKGDVFVFPIGLVHFQRNVGLGSAFLIASLRSSRAAREIEYSFSNERRNRVASLAGC